MSFDVEDGRLYKVVVNDEGQHSIWLVDKPTPAGWRDVDCRGTKAACLKHIRETWLDWRPLSLQRAMTAE